MYGDRTYQRTVTPYEKANETLPLYSNTCQPSLTSVRPKYKVVLKTSHHFIGQCV